MMILMIPTNTDKIMKKVIITGISGQVGSYMAEYCLNLNHHVYGIIRRNSTTNDLNYKHLIGNNNFNVLYGDLSDGLSITSIVESIRPDYFINLGAQSFVGISWQIPEETFNVDVMGVIRCLEAIRKIKPDCRFYNAGSSEQFGNVDYAPQDEKHPFKPRSPYGAAKCASHHIVKVYRESYNMYAIQGLLFNHESERRGLEFVTRKITMGVSKIIDNIKNNKHFDPIELGNLDSKRDWSHAIDFVDGIWRMLNQEIYNKNFNSSKTFNAFNLKEYVLSSNESHTIREFVELSFKCAGYDGHWKFIGENLPENEVFIINVKNEQKVAVKVNKQFYRPLEVESLTGNSDLIRKELNWSPRINFKNLVEKMIKHDLKNVV